MPINENPSLPNRHTGYIAASGYGKSQALKQNAQIPRRGARLIAWDPGADHKGHCTWFRSSEWPAFVRAVRNGMSSGKGFRLAFQGVQEPGFFDGKFCALLWACLDGKRPLYMLLEEMAGVSPSSGAATPNLALLCNQSRKFGGIMHWTTQRPQEISKTLLSQTDHFFIGRPDRFCPPAKVREFATVAECQPEQLRALQQLQFYRVSPTNSQLVKLKYKHL